MSINYKIKHKQDKERFFLLEIERTKLDDYKKGEKFFKSLPNNYYKKFLMTAIMNIKEFKNYYNEFYTKSENHEVWGKYTHHIRRQLSTVLAGFKVLIPAASGLLDKMAKSVPLHNMLDVSTLSESLEDEEEDILKMLVPREFGVGEGVTFSEAVLSKANESLFEQWGVRLVKSQGNWSVAISLKSPVIRRLCINNNIYPLKTNLREFRNYLKLKSQSIRINERQYRCIILDLTDYMSTKKKSHI